MGGVRVLRALNVQPSAWHANEGHAAFMLVERVREYVAAGMPYDDAVARVRSSSAFTTHTPVPAGHDQFGVEQVAECAGPARPARARAEPAAFARESRPSTPSTIPIRRSRC